MRKLFLTLLTVFTLLVLMNIPAFAADTIPGTAIKTDGTAAYFKTFEELEYLTTLNDCPYDLYYIGDTPLMIEDSISFSNHVMLNSSKQPIIVPNNVKVSFSSNLAFAVNEFDIRGIVISSSMINVYERLTVTGKLELESSRIFLQSSDTMIDGLENIDFDSDSWIEQDYDVSTQDELMEALKIADAKTNNIWHINIDIISNTNYELDRSFTIPQNTTVCLAMHDFTEPAPETAIASNCTVTINGRLVIHGNTIVHGTLINHNAISFSIARGTDNNYLYGKLIFSESAVYDGNGTIEAYRPQKAGIEDIISGIDSSQYILTETQEGHIFIYSIVKRPNCTTHTWNAGEETTAPTCTTDGTKAFTCTVCGETKIETLPAIGHSYTDGKCTVCGAADPDYAAPTPTPTPTPDVPDTAENPFTDVADADYFYRPVLWAVDNNITGGLGEGIFGPNEGCTRGQVVTFLWAANGKPEPKSMDNPFDDVADNAWYLKPVLWAVENGITGGTSATTFGPEQTCTRGQIVTFLWAANGKPAVEGESSFTDVTASDWFLNPVLWAAENNVTGGIGEGMFGPNNTCTRGQVVTFLYKVYNK